MNILSVDWAIKKPLYIYDGNEVKETYNPKDIKADIVLLERGAPYSLIAQLNNCKILMVAGEDTSKFRGGIKKTDAEEAVDIYLLYQQKPELFNEIEHRNVIENKLKYHIKMYYSVQRTIIKLNNESKALKREYIESDIHQSSKKYFENIQEIHKEKLIEYARYLCGNDVGVLTNMKGVGELNASVFAALVDVRKFNKYSKFKMFCGYAPKVHTKYSRVIKNVVGTTCRSILMNKIEPYYGIYNSYKQKKLGEGKTKGHADNLGRRKVCQRLLKEFWRRLWNVSEDRNEIDNEMKARIPRVDININVNVNIRIDKKQESLFDY